MKNLIITSLSALALAMAFTGCGDSGSVGGSANTSTNLGSGGVVSVVSGVDAEVTTPKTPYNLSDKLGTPPGLPE